MYILVFVFEIQYIHWMSMGYDHIMIVDILTYIWISLYVDIYAG